MGLPCILPPISYYNISSRSDGWSHFGHTNLSLNLVTTRSSVLMTPPIPMFTNGVPHFGHFFSEFSAIVMRKAFLPINLIIITSRTATSFSFLGILRFLAFLISLVANLDFQEFGEPFSYLCRGSLAVSNVRL